MKAKITTNLLKPKTDEVLLKVDQVVEFTLVDGKNGKACQIAGVPMLIPINVMVKHAQFTKDTKAELIRLGLIEDTDKQPANDQKKEAPADSKKQPAANAEKGNVAIVGLCGALYQLNEICKNSIMGMHITRIDNELIEGDITFFSTKVPPVNFSIGAGDFANGKLEQEVTKFIEDHSQIITNKLELIESLDEQIKARQEELQKVKDEKATTNPAIGKSGRSKTTATATKAKPAEEKKEDDKPADLFDAAQAQAEEAPEELEESGDFDEPNENPVDDNEFDE